MRTNGVYSLLVEVRNRLTKGLKMGIGLGGGDWNDGRHVCEFYFGSEIRQVEYIDAKWFDEPSGFNVAVNYNNISHEVASKDTKPESLVARNCKVDVFRYETQGGDVAILGYCKQNKTLYLPKAK